MAGLGNPGLKYVRTPHNAGFAVLDLLAERLGTTWREESRHTAWTARVRAEMADLLLVKPLTYMNASGRAVGALLRYYNVASSDLVVVSDDADLPAGRLRIRTEGGSGGHRGLESVIEACGTEAFTRVRVGVGRGAADMGLIDHVLGRLSASDEEALRQTVDVAADAVLCLVAQGAVAAMNRFNGWQAADTPPVETNERG